MSSEVALDTVISGNKVRGLLWPLDQYANQAACLAVECPFLLPEIEAANGHIVKAIETIHRAVEVLEARLDVEMGHE